MSMTSNRPYLIRACYDWIVDNNCTPYLAVDAYYPGVEVPQSYVNDGQIVLNIAPRAVMDMEFGNDLIRFNTRFGGVPTDIQLPVDSVMGIYARENGQGMIFEVARPPDPDKPSPKVVKKSKKKATAKKGPSKKESGGKKPPLRVVK